VRKSRGFYDSLYERLAESRTFELVVREACRDDFNPGVVSFSFGGLKEFESYLHVARMYSVRSVLDIGCGYGDLSTAIAATLPAHVTGLDISPVAIRRATARARTRQLLGFVDFVVGDMNALQDIKDEFDAVFAVDALHHSRSHECIPALAQRLRKGGVLRFTTWLERSESNLPEATLGELSASGLAILHVAVTHQEMAHQARMYQLTYRYRERLAKEISEEFVCLMLSEALHLSSRRVERCMVTAIRM
jgi:2-polyprenyl-3-methyl-5-hydroxy-6-metoxy-1,4-benzoquinol methylase